MGVDVHILVRHDFYELDDYEKSEQFVKSTIDIIRQELYINEDYEYFALYGYYDKAEKWSQIEFTIPLFDITINLRKGYWDIWSGCHYCQVTNKINGRLHITDDAFDIARALGQNEVWYCDEFIVDEFYTDTLNELLTAANERFGITEFPYLELMQYEDNSFPEVAQFYHYSFSEINKEFDELCVMCKNSKPTCINRFGSGFIRTVADGKINLINIPLSNPVFDNGFGNIQKLIGPELICKKGGKVALFNSKAEQLTDFVVGNFEWERADYHPLDDFERIYYFNHEAQIKIMATYYEDSTIKYVKLPYKSMIVKRKPIKCPLCKGEVVNLLNSEFKNIKHCKISNYRPFCACVECKTEFVKE